MTSHFLFAILGACLTVMTLASPASCALKVAYSEDVPWMMTQNNDASGIAIDILREAANRADIELEFVKAAPNACLSMLKKGSVDLLPEVREDAKLESYADYITPPYLTGRSFVIYSLRDKASLYPRYEKLRWHYVATVKGETYFEPFTIDRTIAKKRYNSLSTAFSRLLSSNVHAVATTECEGGYWLATHQDLARDISRTGIQYDEYNPVYFAVSRKSQNMAEATALGSALISMIQDGAIEDIRARYIMGY